jgi:hypothetical protein
MPSSVKLKKIRTGGRKQKRTPTPQLETRNNKLARGAPKKFAPFYSYLLLSVTTIMFLAPFSGRAFHVDDTLFMWTARQIVKQPLNPYGFDLVWDTERVPMSEVTQNPPLASYYAPYWEQ